MKKKILIFLSFSFLLLGGIVSGPQVKAASLDSAGEKITDFKVKITINQDSSLIVEEKILYDFGGHEQHGIYRDFKKDKLKVKVLEVSQDDQFVSYETSKSGNYLGIRIGDPDKLITGVHLYKIVYQIKNAIGFFEDHDELYFNVTGDEWTVPIEKASAEVILPQEIEQDKLKLTAYTGSYGATGANYDKAVQEKTIVFESIDSFNPQEGLTIVVGLPKGILKEPSFLERIIGNLDIFWPFLIPFFVFIYLFNLWWKKGKDFRIKKTVIAQYEPPENLRPALVSFLIKQRSSEKEISATLIDLAVKGYLKIKEIKEGWSKDFELIKLQKEPEPEGLLYYEKELLDLLFKTGDSVKISSLKNKLSDHKRFFALRLRTEMEQLLYFSPASLRIQSVLYFLAAILIVSFFGFLRIQFILAFSNAISGAIMLFFSSIMPKRTPKGAEAYWQTLGFKEYLKTAEKYRLEFQEKEKIFEKFLPYAMVLGVVRFWTKAFEGIYKEPPSWYEGYYIGVFSTTVFADSLGHFETGMRNVFTAAGGGGSGFSGGFSGGGGGGGGGGSW